jgi:hypothetical protein
MAHSDPPGFPQRVSKKAAGAFYAGLGMATCGLAVWIAGLITSQYAFELAGTGSLALGTVATTLALIAGEQDYLAVTGLVANGPEHGG